MYNLSALDYTDVITSISDTKGKNTYIFSTDIKDDKIYFDLTVKKNAKADKNGNYKYTLGKNIVFTETFTGGNYSNGVEIAGRANISKITIDTTDYKLDINSIAQNVANWLGSNHLTSTSAVLNSSDTTQINELMAIYTGSTVNDCLVNV